MLAFLERPTWLPVTAVIPPAFIRHAVACLPSPPLQVRNLGKPVELAGRYFDEGADEVTFLNITGGCLGWRGGQRWRTCALPVWGCKVRPAHRGAPACSSWSHQALPMHDEVAP